VIRDTSRLQNRAFDLLIIGGGIAGAGAARDAALRGLRVALIDQGDFGSGTSSRSSKLVHGGLRYLEHGAFRLVREACRERRVLLRIAPHLVDPLPLLFPCYRGSGRPLWQVRLGLALYDALSGDLRIERHRMMTPEQVRDLEPGLTADRLEGGGHYYDCRMNDARLCLENVKAADEAGAVVANYVQLAGFEKSSGRLAGAHLKDLISGRDLEVRAKVILNVTGPWADAPRRLDDPSAPPLVRKTRGVHLITRRLTRAAGVAFTARSDGRLLFLLPLDEGHSLIGTTDTDSEEDPAMPAVESTDVEYLLSEVNMILPGAQLERSNVVGHFAGLRTLINDRGDPTSLSREYKIVESDSGLISLIGGKYTTYRIMAGRLVDRVLTRLGLSAHPARTDTPLPSAPPAGVDACVQELERLIDAKELDRRTIHALVRRYGTAARRVIELASEEPGGGDEMVPATAVIWAEARYAMESEMAIRPMDFLRRRTGLALRCTPDPAVLARLVKLYANRYGWDADRSSVEEKRAQESWASHHTGVS